MAGKAGDAGSSAVSRTCFVTIATGQAHADKNYHRVVVVAALDADVAAEFEPGSDN